MKQADAPESVTIRIFAFGCSFAIPGLLAANYTLNYFYGRGSAVWDAGWFASLSAGTAAWPLTNPPAIGGEFLAVHMSPIFLLIAAVHRWCADSTSAPVFFSMTQGLWQGILGASLAWCLCRTLRAWMAGVLAILCAGNGIALAALGFPHFEIATTSLLVAFLALWLAPPAQARLLWLLPLVILLCVREDSGAQAACVLGVIGFWRKTHPTIQQLTRGDVALAVLCAASSVFELVLQHHLFPSGGGSLSTTYLGSPSFAHLSLGFLKHRLYDLAIYRPYIWVPLLLSTVAAAVTSDSRLILGALACLPWLALDVIARSDLAGEMTSYYGLPMMIGLLWPALASSPGLGASSALRRRYMWLQAAMTVLSMALFAGYGVANHDPQPWRRWGFAWTRTIRPMEAAVDCLVREKKHLGHVVVDDAVASLRLWDFSPDELHYAGQFTPHEQLNTDILIEQPGTWGKQNLQELARRAGLTEHASWPGTPFIYSTRRPLSLCGLH